METGALRNNPQLVNIKILHGSQRSQKREEVILKQLEEKEPLPDKETESLIYSKNL